MLGTQKPSIANSRDKRNPERFRTDSNADLAERSVGVELMSNNTAFITELTIAFIAAVGLVEGKTSGSVARL